MFYFAAFSCNVYKICVRLKSMIVSLEIRVKVTYFKAECRIAVIGKHHLIINEAKILP